jgi:hypothetical protein
MKTFRYSDRKKLHPEGCQVCGKRYPENMLAPHHVYRRYSDVCIWVCLGCHTKIHNDVGWAFKKGYLRHRKDTDKRMRLPKKKKKRCKHKKKYYDAKEDVYVCQICGKKFKKIKKYRS